MVSYLWNESNGFFLVLVNRGRDCITPPFWQYVPTGESKVLPAYVRVVRDPGIQGSGGVLVVWGPYIWVRVARSWPPPWRVALAFYLLVGITNASFYDSQIRSSNQPSLEPTYDKTQVDIRLFNILYRTSKRKTQAQIHKEESSTA